MIEELSEHFSIRSKVGWDTIGTKDGQNIDGFRTDRIAKIMANGELQFTIGSNEPGRSANLNSVISDLVSSRDLEVLERRSTSGSSTVDRVFPSIATDGLDVNLVIGLLKEVESTARSIGGGEPYDPTAITKQAALTSRAADIYRQYRAHIRSEAALEAFRILLVNPSSCALSLWV